MSEAKFTPGVWGLDASTYGDEIDIYPLRDGHPEIGRWAEICVVKDYEGSLEMKANAHLIAAAPELYEVLSEAMERGGVIQMCLYGKALAALAKARGEV